MAIQSLFSKHTKFEVEKEVVRHFSPNIQHVFVGEPRRESIVRLVSSGDFTSLKRTPVGMAATKHEEHHRSGQQGEVVEENVMTVDASQTPSEDGSDRTSNPGSVGGTSTDDDSIVTPAAVAAAAASQIKKQPLSKQPSNGIHVLKPDAPAVGGALPPYPEHNGDAMVNKSNNNTKEEEITFDPNGSYYMANACCELIHYRTGAILVAAAEIVMMIVWGYFMTQFYMSPAGGIGSVGAKVSIGIQPVVAVGFTVAIVLMLVGVFTERPYLLWPHMLVQIFGIILGIAFTVVAVIAMCAGTSLAESIFSFIYGAHNLPKVEAALGPIWPFCLAVVFDFGAALGIWFYIVIKGCYEYLMDKVFFENEMQSLTLKKENLDGTTAKKQLQS